MICRPRLSALRGRILQIFNQNSTIQPPAELRLPRFTYIFFRPFLTQRLCSLVIQENNPTPDIPQLVQCQIIKNWETQDEQEHLRTIQNRILSNEQRAGRLLGLYQQILDEGGILVDGNPEQVDLQLTGLVVKRGDKLEIYNPIYREVFNRNWVEEKLTQLRPSFYGEAIKAWLVYGKQDESRLLRGKALQEAQAWAEGKSLSDLDYQFLAASQKLDRREVEIALKAEKEAANILAKANNTLSEAQTKAKRTIRTGGIFFSLSLIGAIIVAVVTGIKAREQIEEAQIGTLLEQQGVEIRRQLPEDNVYYGGNSEGTELLYLAMETGQKLYNIVKDGRSLDKYPAITPLYVLRQVLSKFRASNKLKGHQNSLTDVEFSPNGQMIATASQDKTARIWDLKGNQLAILKGHQDYVESLKFSPNGQMIATAFRDGTAEIWDLQRNELAVFKVNQNSVESLEFSPDGQMIATASDDKTARIWDLKGNQLAILKGHEYGVKDVEFSPDGQMIATASHDKTARIWDLKGNQLAVFKGHQDVITSVKFSSDGQMIATASKHGTVKIWDLQGNELAVFKVNQNSVESLEFSPDGQYLATASYQSTARIWDLQASLGNTLHANELVVLKHQKSVVDIEFSPNGQMIATGSWDSIARVWDIEGNELAVLKGYGVKFSPDGQMLAIVSGERGKIVRIWDIKGNQLLVLKHQYSVNDVKFSPEEQMLATTSRDGTARVWDLKGNQLTVFKGHQGIFPGHQPLITLVEFHPNGQMLATIASQDKDNTARIWDIQGNQLLVLKHQHSVRDVKFSPDGQMLAIVSGEGGKIVRIWDLKGNELAVFKGHQDLVSDVAFHPNGQMIATASHDETARIWDLKGNELAVFKGHQGFIYDVEFSSDGQILATASGDKTARIWDLKGNELAVFKGHQDIITSVKFSSDGQILATASGDKTARIWAVEGLEEMLNRGCFLLELENYFVYQFEALETLTKCQDSINKVAVAPGLVNYGVRLAEQKDIPGAIAKFQKALEWNPDLEILANSWNKLCWIGSLNGAAAEVMFACEKAVAQKPENENYRDSRGLAKAITGDTAGAISDFQAYIEGTDSKNASKQRQKWIDELRAGKNPFTEEVLESLK